MVSRSLWFLVALLLMTAAGVSRAGAVPDRWVGSYSYQYVMGHAAGQPAPAWVFNLMIKADGGCELTWQGYQKDDDILCKASGSEDALRIYYASFAGGDVFNSAGFQVYKPDEKLMELETIKGSGKIFTKWWALNKGGVLRNGVRFERD